MVDLVEVVSSSDVEIGRVGVELLADTVSRGDSAIAETQKSSSCSRRIFLLLPVMK